MLNTNRYALLLAFFAFPVIPVLASDIGYVGCSISNQAIAGYSQLGGSDFWPPQKNYGGGGIEEWSNVSSSSRYWVAFQEAYDSDPTNIIWWQLCTREDGTDEYKKAVVIYDEIRRRVPSAVIYISAQPTYRRITCPITGPLGSSRMQRVADRLVAENRGLNGPTIGPLTSSTTGADLCHANAAGEELMGQQLLDFPF